MSPVKEDSQQKSSATSEASTKKAVIRHGSKQYLVSEKQTLDVELISDNTGTIKFKPLLVVDGSKVQIGKPELEKSTVTAKLIEETKDDKVLAIRYKAKKRVHKVRGHRQKYSRIQITKID